MIVFVAGMPRSGSTFSYNVVRELLQKRGGVRKEHSFDLASMVAGKVEADHLVLKAHSADDLTAGLIRLGAIKAICTVRRPEDAIASWTEIFGHELEVSLDMMLQWLKMFERIRDHATLVQYDEIDRHSVRAAFRIGKTVCSDAGTVELLQIARRYSKKKVAGMTAKMRPEDEGNGKLPFSYYNSETLFHRRHVSSLVSRSAAERIGDMAVSTIRSRLEKWVDDDGNLRLKRSN